MEALNLARIPAFDLSYNGRAITRDIAPYVISASYTDNLTGEADSLDIELEDVGLQCPEAEPPHLLAEPRHVVVAAQLLHAQRRMVAHPVGAAVREIHRQPVPHLAAEELEDRQPRRLQDRIGDP